MGINVELIRSSFDVAKSIADQVADKFYEILWEDYPQAKALFDKTNMEAQKKALMGSLTFSVDNLENPDELVPFLKKMGERHINYGTAEEHYDWVGASLIKTFAHFFGDEWTDELEKEWLAVYTFVATTMKEGAKEHTPKLSEIRSKAKVICDGLLKEILEEGIDEEFEQYVRAKVRKVLFKVLEEESEELLNINKAA